MAEVAEAVVAAAVVPTNCVPILIALGTSLRATVFKEPTVGSRSIAVDETPARASMRSKFRANWNRFNDMLRWFFRRKLNSEEQRLGASMDYLRHIVDVSPTAFLRFAATMPFANSRNVLPADAWFAAQLVALQREDCGPCVQIAVNLAREANVAAALIQAILAGDFASVSPEIRDVCEFTQATLDADERACLELRESLRARFSDRGLIELAYAIAASRIPPTIKRTLGYAKHCHEVRVDIPADTPST